MQPTRHLSGQPGTKPHIRPPLATYHRRTELNFFADLPLPFLRYLSVQIIAYAVDMGSFLLMIDYAGLGPLMSNAAGKVLAGTFAFMAHRHFSFETASEGNTSQQAISYFALLTLNVPLSSAALKLMLLFIPVISVAKFTADILFVLLTFWLTKKFVFRSRDRLPRDLDKGSTLIRDDD